MAKVKVVAKTKKLTPSQKAKKLRGVPVKSVDLTGWHERQGMEKALKAIPAEHKEARSAVRAAIREHLDKDK